MTNSTFTGFMHLIDKDDDVVFAEKIDKGITDDKLFFDKEFKNKAVANKMIEDCSTYRINNYIDWYKITTNSDGTQDIVFSSSQLVNITYQTICYTYFIPSGGGGFANTGNGEPSPYDCGDPLHGCIDEVKDMIDNCGDGLIKDENGGCVPDEIIDKLTNPCAKNIFEGLQNNLYTQDPLKPEIIIPNEAINLNFSESILKLFNDSNSTTLLIRNGDIGNANAHTIGTSITLDNSYIESATQLSIARSMIHELVHAYLNALYSNVVEFKSYTFRQKLERYASDNGYIIGTNRFQHEFMGQFVEAMAYSLYEWDRDYGTGGNLSWDYYYAMGFGGLFQTDTNGTIVAETNSFKNIIPDPAERQKIADIIFNELKNNQDAKGTKCN